MSYTATQLQAYILQHLLHWMWSGDQVSAKEICNLQEASLWGQKIALFVSPSLQLARMQICCDGWSSSSHIGPWGRNLVIRVESREIESWVLVAWWRHHTNLGLPTFGFLLSKKETDYLLEATIILGFCSLWPNPIITDTSILLGLSCQSF